MCTLTSLSLAKLVHPACQEILRANELRDGCWVECLSATKLFMAHFLYVYGSQKFIRLINRLVETSFF
jgi:hypothetical protein